MKRLLLIVLLRCLLLVVDVQAQSFSAWEKRVYISDFEKEIFAKRPSSAFSYLFASEYSSDSQTVAYADIHIEKFCTSIRKDFVADKKSLQKVFKAVHKRFLYEYTEFPSFEETITKGKYNCVTATALLAWVYQHLGVRYAIYETQYHVFMYIFDNEGNTYLIESTDAYSGFIAGEDKVQRKIEEYRQDSQKKGNHFVSDFTYNSEVTLKQLAGLQYYNRAADFLNRGNYGTAITLLENGSLLYPCKRISELLILAVEQHLLSANTDSKQKEVLLKKYNVHYLMLGITPNHAIVNAKK